MKKFAPSRSNMRTPKQQRGVGTLVISLILLISMTLIAFFANKSLLFEQKTSANQMRSTTAFEAAEAGLEWATSMLNDVRYIDTNCTTVGTNTQSFRSKYLPYSAAAGFAPVSTAFPGCSMSDASGSPMLSCACPASGTSLASSNNPSFTVEFKPVNSTTLPGTTPDKESVLVTAYGCTSAVAPCVPHLLAPTEADAFQSVSVILKLRPALRSVPASAVTTGGSLQLTSAASSISNTDGDANGTLVNAGGGINSVAVAGCTGSFKDFKTTSTLPGTPRQNSMIANDTSLSALSANSDAMFNSYFGTTIAQFKASTSTKTLTNCGTVENDYDTAFKQGYRAFQTTCYFQTNKDLGTVASPIIFVTTNGLKFNGGADIYGLIYGDQATWDEVGAGNGSINGALIVRGNYCANANADYNYRGDLLKNIRGLTGTMARIPGSWKDF